MIPILYTWDGFAVMAGVPCYDWMGMVVCSAVVILFFLVHS